MANWQSFSKSAFGQYLFALLIIALCTIIGLPLREHVATTNLTMIYLTGVVIAASRLGIGPSIFASVLSVFAFNFFFTKPYHSLRFYDNSYYFTFSVMLITSLLVGSMTAQLSKLLAAARKEEKETHALYDFARGLSQLQAHDEILDFALNFIGRVFNAGISLGENGQIDKKLIAKLAEKNEPIGNGCKIEGALKTLYVPNVRENAILLSTPNDEMRKFTRAEIMLHQTYTSLLANSLKRAQATQEAAFNKIESENEKLRNVLLSSLSHDLRTPLTIMNGKVSNLLKYRKSLPREGVGELTSLWQQLKKLQNFVSNLLRMASISSGHLKLNCEIYSIQEIIGAAILRIEEAKGNRKILSQIDGQIPFVNVDGALIEQVIFNLFDNAITHTKDDGTIKIAISKTQKMVEVQIIDNGDGIENGQENLIFEKFQSNSQIADSQSGGTGLGLAICKAIINAHNGQIRAFNNAKPEKGACFALTIPMAEKENE